jgi:hypothetical protein
MNRLVDIYQDHKSKRRRFDFHEIVDENSLVVNK